MIYALFFIIIFIGGIIAAVWVDAYYAICLYIMEYFIHPPGRWWGRYLPDLRYAFSIGAVATATFFMRHRKYSENKILNVPQSKWLILLGLIIVLTWPIAVDQNEHQQFMVIFIKYLALYFIMVKVIDTPEKFEKIIGVFILGQFYLGWVVYQVGRTAEGRVEGMGTADAKDANGLAAVLVVVVPFLIHYLITGKRWQKLCSLPVIVFVLNGLILINSRGAFLAVLVSLSYYLLSSFRAPSSLKIGKLKILAGIIAGLLIFLYLADSIFWDRMSTITISSENEQKETYTGRERVDFWFTTFDMLKSYPLGVGAMGYEKLSPQYLPKEVLSVATKTRAVHSTYFEVLSEYGYHGFFVFCMFLLSNIRYIWKLKKRLIQKKLYEPYHMAIAIEAAFLAHLIAAVFINRFYSEILYWSSAFIAIYGNIYFRKMSQAEDVAVPDMA